MSLFEYSDYRAYLRAHIHSLPRKGRGELSKISQHLQVNATLLSQIMSGLRDFNQEQAYSLSLYLGHTELETDYFSLLVQLERAGTKELKDHLRKKIESAKTESLKLSKRIRSENKLSEAQRTVFYSRWIYSAVHIFTSLGNEGATMEQIAQRFDLPKVKAAEILQFLLSAGVVIEKSGYYFPGLQNTFVEQGSPHLLKHHANWRIKAVQKSESLSPTDLMITGQYSLSKKDFLHLREQLTEFTKKLSATLKDTEPEEIVCFNVDWFILD